MSYTMLFNGKWGGNVPMIIFDEILPDKASNEARHDPL